MTWYFNEQVSSGSATANVKSWFPETGFIVLYNIDGDINVGSTITGKDSGTVLTLTQFNVSLDYDNIQYDPYNWDEVLETYIYDGNGEIIATEEYFTGYDSQDYQTTYLVVKDQ